MTLFQILTRYVAIGKIKVTRKLLNRVRREAGGKRNSKPPEPRERKHRGFRRSCCAALVSVLTLLFCPVNGHAATVPQAVESDSATSTYSAAALFNRANANARDGKPGLAILNYERAQLLAPNDSDIAANLHLVRAKAGLPGALENWLTRNLTYSRPNTMAWLGCFGLVLAGMGMVLVRLHSRRRVAIHSLTFTGALLVASAIGSAAATWPRMKEAVIIARDVAAYASPVSSAESTFKLREGETVAVRAVHQDFALVQTPAGRSGWVARRNLTCVVPQVGNLAPSPNRT
jgi:hypothetical protein